jgi:hypothetical protein
MSRAWHDLFPTELVTKVKPNINSVELHSQLSNKGHPVDGALVSAGSLWQCEKIFELKGFIIFKGVIWHKFMDTHPRNNIRSAKIPGHWRAIHKVVQ